MGAPKTEGRHGGSSLALLACVILGTLALSVPSTALLMLYLSREGGSANDTGQELMTSMEAKVEAQQNDRLPNMIRAPSDMAKPAAHLTGMDPAMNEDSPLVWKYRYNVAFPDHRPQDRSLSLLIPQAGFYYVYCQVGFRGSNCPIGKIPLTLYSRITQYHDSYDKEGQLLEGLETVCSRGNDTKMWYTSLSLGALGRFKRNHRLTVKVSHPKLVDYDDGRTFFGVMMVS